MNVEIIIGNSMMEEFSPPNDLKTPVLFLVFNRLSTTIQVFDEIKTAKPPRLYIASDGAREAVEGEFEKVKEIRDYLISNIDWKCEVKTLFRDKNLGCKYAVSGAIDWFFENEEMGIILEDDCLPSQSFFWYCEELLSKYKDDKRIALISGYNKQNEWMQNNTNYFFSNYGGIWGWASWSRSWEYYDVEMRDFNEFVKQNHFENLLGKKLGTQRQEMIHQNINIKKVDTWDYQWAYARHKQNGLACVPVKSLIENIGFGEDATHTIYQNDEIVNRHELNFPSEENYFVIPDREYDELYFKKKNILLRILSSVKRRFKF